MVQAVQNPHSTQATVLPPGTTVARVQPPGAQAQTYRPGITTAISGVQSQPIQLTTPTGGVQISLARPNQTLGVSSGNPTKTVDSSQVGSSVTSFLS